MVWSLRNDVTALVATLDAEHGALTDGAHERLARLAQRKERLLSAIARDPGPAQAQRLRAEVMPRLERNRTLLLAAGEGVRAAMRAIDSAPAGRALHTYRADGARQGGATAPATLERRA